MEERTGGQLLVDCLKRQGVRRAFGVPGESYLAVLDALYDTPEIQMIGNRHEGGAAFMAAAHGQLTGKPGVCFVTRGPGATNAAIGVHTAMQGSLPMVLFIGQIARDMTDREAFQEIDYRQFFGPVAKWVTQIDSAARIPELVNRAFAVAQSGRKGPVVVALPEDMLRETTNARPVAKAVLPTASPPAVDITRLTEMLGHSRRPLVLLGGTGWTAQGRADLRRFVEANYLPVAAAFRFQDVLDNHSPSYIGDAGLGKTPAMQRALQESDLILALNVRFGENTTDGWTLFTPPDIGRRLVHVHPSDGELNKIYHADLPIQSDPNALVAALANLSVADPTWRENTADARVAFLESLEVPPQPGPVDMGAVIRHLQATLPEDAILTNGAGNFAIWHNKLFLYGEKARLIAPQSGAMGYGLPAAIAAKAEFPDRCVICITGDGDFQMNATELGTAMQHGIAPIVLIVNNGTYGTIRMHQERHYPGRVSFTDIQNPEFQTFAKAYGMHAERVEKTEQFSAALMRARESKTGAVLELIVGAQSLTPRQTLDQIRHQGFEAKGQK